ncbi:unnamed protein product [Angiostrongylus costaricensis]|uniref:serine--tRNA ligase n=1 Tax=Angiostrongylus costaricensis TaxID=334426 RepID=A0A0R3PNL8_ANGCS|nr:unnamed protein product [Angiostrongylus costaricensis]
MQRVKYFICFQGVMRRTLSSAAFLFRSYGLINQIFKLHRRDLCTSRRPELDFDFLLDDSNLEAIRRNIAERKGVGDIDTVRAKWTELNKVMDAKEKPDINEERLKRMWDNFYHEALRIPNMSHPDVPRGDEKNAKVLCTWGTKREGPCVTAEELVHSWRTLFYPTDASGERSYAFVGALANLERALLEYVFDRVCVLDFKPISVPDLVSKEVTEACGLFQSSPKSIQYSLEDEPNVVLSGTGEMGVASCLQNQIVDEERLPLRFVTMSRCYRPEISNSAHEAKLYRVHEFNKVEMFVICTPDQSDGELNYLVEIQKGTFESPRTFDDVECMTQLDMPSEELGAPAARKVDIEVWMPGREIFGEVSSASNCTDYQARRLNIRYKTKSDTKEFVHTCNGTAIASTRTLIGLLESFQTVCFQIFKVRLFFAFISHTY